MKRPKNSVPVGAGGFSHRRESIEPTKLFPELGHLNKIINQSRNDHMKRTGNQSDSFEDNDS